MEILVKLSEEERVLLNKVSEITLGSYDINKDTIPVEKLIIIIQDLMVEYHKLEEERDELNQIQGYKVLEKKRGKKR